LILEYGLDSILFFYAVECPPGNKKAAAVRAAAFLFQ
jgi:hypothetical protein